MRAVLQSVCTAAIAFAVLGCAIAPSENKLVGTWVKRAVGRAPEEMDSRPGPQDAVVKMIFTADHTFMTYSTDQPGVSTAVWSVEGNELVVRGGKIEDRVPIARLTDTQLVILVGHEYSKSTWWRSGAF